MRQGRNPTGCYRTWRNWCATGFASVLLSRGKALAKPVAPSPVAAEGCAAFQNANSQTSQKHNSTLPRDRIRLPRQETHR